MATQIKSLWVFQIACKPTLRAVLAAGCGKPVARQFTHRQSLLPALREYAAQPGESEGQGVWIDDRVGKVNGACANNRLLRDPRSSLLNHSGITPASSSLSHSSI